MGCLRGLQYAQTTTCTAVTASSSLSGIAAAGTASDNYRRGHRVPELALRVFRALSRLAHKARRAVLLMQGHIKFEHRRRAEGTYTHSVGGRRPLELW